MRVVFCGNPDFALPTLEALHTSRHEVEAVVCSPDKPMGRGKKVGSPPVKRRALELGTELLQPESLKDSGFLHRIAALQPAALVVVAFLYVFVLQHHPCKCGYIFYHPLS